MKALPASPYCGGADRAFYMKSPREATVINKAATNLYFKTFTPQVSDAVFPFTTGHGETTES